MSQDNKSIVRLFFHLLERNSALPEELLAADIRYHVPGSPPLDLTAMRQRAEAFRSAFSDHNRTLQQLISEGDLVAFISTIEVTHTGEFLGIAPTGKRVSFM